jgi:hypothetical protein
MDFSSILTNKNVTLMPFRWYHPRAMNLRRFDREAYANLPNFDERLRYYETQPHSYTAFVRGKPASCFGVHEIWPGVGEGWLITDEIVAKFSVTLTRSTMRYFNLIAIEKKLHRIQLTVNTKDLLAVRWAHALKFEQEGVMRKYGPDQTDYLMMSRTSDEQPI